VSIPPLGVPYAVGLILRPTTPHASLPLWLSNVLVSIVLPQGRKSTTTPQRTLRVLSGNIGSIAIGSNANSRHRALLKEVSGSASNEPSSIVVRTLKLRRLLSVFCFLSPIPLPTPFFTDSKSCRYDVTPCNLLGRYESSGAFGCRTACGGLRSSTAFINTEFLKKKKKKKQCPFPISRCHSEGRTIYGVYALQMQQFIEWPRLYVYAPKFISAIPSQCKRADQWDSTAKMKLPCAWRFRVLTRQGTRTAYMIP
jgi:hypothetical protein